MSLQLTADEKARICRWYSGDGCNKVSISVIARRLRRNRQTIVTFLRSLSPSRAYAKALLEASISTHVERITEFANVEQSMEMLHRLDVLGKKDQSSLHGNVTVMVGMPGAPAIAAPSQETIDAAKAERALPAAIPGEIIREDVVKIPVPVVPED